MSNLQRFGITGFLMMGMLLFAACDSGAGENDGLPPDPGEEGMATLEGIDSDGDGVRDDVQRYIFLNYEDEATRKALVQYAKAELKAILVADNKQASIELFEDVGKAIECITSIHPDDSPQITALMVSVMFNTRERTEAYIRSSNQGSGETFRIRNPLDWADSCQS